jgi:hypothetical protein
MYGFNLEEFYSLLVMHKSLVFWPAGWQKRLLQETRRYSWTDAERLDEKESHVKFAGRRDL